MSEASGRRVEESRSGQRPSVEKAKLGRAALTQQPVQSGLCMHLYYIDCAATIHHESGTVIYLSSDKGATRQAAGQAAEQWRR